MKVKVYDDSDQYKAFFDEVLGYYSDQDDKEDTEPISKRIKEFREMQGLSIDQFSRISGIDKDKLSKIEMQEIFPDIGTIVKLSKSLRITTSLLLGDESGYSYSIVRKEDRKKMKRFITGTKERTNYAYQSLTRGIKNRHMESFIVTLTGEKENVELSSHDGEEFIMVLESSIKIMLGNKEETLKEGDCIYFLSSIPHYITTVSKGESAVLLGVIYTG